MPGLLFDLPHLKQSGADGIGLFRTELQFMISETFPRLEQQTRLYKSILDQAAGRPVVFRSLDVGGDKVIPYFRGGAEENPALGWRAIRMALDRPALFRTQIRALLRAAHGRELRILLPMISDVSEFEAARGLIDRELTLLKTHGRPEPATLMVGAMVEVPALLWQLDHLLPMTDFVSVGSNDLIQFLFAADRGNERVSGRFDSLNPAALRALRHIVREADRLETPLTLVWRDGRQAPRGHGAARTWIPFYFHGAGLGRAGQGHGACRWTRTVWPPSSKICSIAGRPLCVNN